MARNTSDGTMHALYMTKSSESRPNLELTKLPIPQPTLPVHVLVKIHASAIQPADLMNTLGGFPNTTLPRIPGRDFAGIVVAAGSSSLAQGLLNKEVYGTSGPAVSFTRDGMHAEYALLDADGVALKPRNLTFVQAASVGVPFSTASLIIERAKVVKDETVLVLGGTGSVGNAVVQQARQKGCKVFVAGRRDSVDVNLQSDSRLESVKQLTGGKGVNVIIDTTGDPNLVTAGIAVLATRGRLSFISAPKGGASTEINGLDMLSMYRMEKELIGVNSLLYSAQELAVKMEEFRNGFDSGALVAPVEQQFTTVDLNGALEAYGKMEAKAKNKFVIVIN